MSTDLFSVHDDAGRRLTLTRFSRGAGKGVFYQITIDPPEAGYVTFSAEELHKIASAIDCEAVAQWEREVRRRGNG